MRIACYLSVPQRSVDAIKGTAGAPALSNEGILSHLKVEHVEGVVDGFDLLHLDDPGSNLLLSTLQHSAAVVRSLGQYLCINK
jgi:hypothetical protein